MTHLILLGVVLALRAFIYFLHYASRRTKGALVGMHDHSARSAGPVVQPLSWHGAAVAALICALILVVLAARLWVA